VRIEGGIEKKRISILPFLCASAGGKVAVRNRTAFPGEEKGRKGQGGKRKGRPSRPSVEKSKRRGRTSVFRQRGRANEKRRGESGLPFSACFCRRRVIGSSKSRRGEGKKIQVLGGEETLASVWRLELEGKRESALPSSDKTYRGGGAGSRCPS